MQMINNSDLPKVSTQPRPKNESKEDKRARKQAIKEERKVTAPSDVGLAKSCWGDRVRLCKCNLDPLVQERRTEKKANKLAFKLEKRRQEKELLNLKNIEGLKL